MTQIQKIVAMSAAAVGVAICPTLFAQDDLDDLLREIEAETTAGEAKAETKAEEKPAAEPEKKAEETAVEAPAAEPEKKAEETAVEAPAAEPEEEKAEEAVAEAEEKAEEKPAEPAAEEKVAEAPAATELKPAVAAKDELIANIVQTERVRRQALDAQAQREINAARVCMKNAEYDEAVHHYGLAQKLLNDRASVKELRKECDQGIAEGLYRAALQERDLGRRQAAIEKMEKAVDMRHPKARRMLEKWVDEGAVKQEKINLADIKHRKNDADYKEQRALILQHLRRSKQYLALRDMEKALEECEIVLVNDPYNEEALRIRNAIEKKRAFILEKERKAARDGWIADVDQAWRPVYAVNAAKLGDTNAETVKAQTGEDPERTMEQEIEARMKAMRLPNISFKPPATIIDAVEFFRQASKDYDRPDIPAEKRGFNFVLRTPPGAIKSVAVEEESEDFTSNEGDTSDAPSNGLEPIQTITASDITFYEAMKLVCDSVGYKFIVSGQVVMVMPQDMSTAELIARKYNVPEAFVERVSTATEELKTMGGGAFGANNRKSGGEEEASEGQDWKAFFEEMGVKWPEGSSIKHIKALGKLYVRNTRENLAEFEKVLDELGGQPQLIEIETRFVEVSQEDLNSLGFEWLLNSDYSLDVGNRLGKALGISRSTWGTESRTHTISQNGSTGYSYDQYSDSKNADGSLAWKNTTAAPTYTQNGSVSETIGNTRTYTYGGNGGSLMKDSGSPRTIGINGFGGTSDYSNGNRYLSTSGNHISGESKSVNDQFMRVNAFLGNADLSLILHMLSQRSDTDLLSAPKVVTKSGENAVIKVVTEYIYPQDYDVQLQSSSSSSSSSSSGGSQSAILAVVEPQNFTMREVGVILDVTPTYSEANGGTIDLELKPQVVDEPTWKNYGMKIPFTGNSASSSLTLGQLTPPFPNANPPEELQNSIISDFWNAVAQLYRNLGGGGSNNNITYYDAPMEQPFFHVRSIDSKVSITPGSTVVMGGLITEARKAMDDKVPFLGDLPFVGRLFRSHAEQTIKRNLLIFVTGRLITPSGRELKMNEQPADEAEVKAAPKAE